MNPRLKRAAAWWPVFCKPHDWRCAFYRGPAETVSRNRERHATPGWVIVV